MDRVRDVDGDGRTAEARHDEQLQLVLHPGPVDRKIPAELAADRAARADFRGPRGLRCERCEARRDARVQLRPRRWLRGPRDVGKELKARTRLPERADLRIHFEIGRRSRVVAVDQVIVDQHAGLPVELQAGDDRDFGGHVEPVLAVDLDAGRVLGVVVGQRAGHPEAVGELLVAVGAGEVVHAQDEVVAVPRHRATALVLPRQPPIEEVVVDHREGERMEQVLRLHEALQGECVLADVDDGGVGEAERIDIAPGILQHVGERALLRIGQILLLGQRAGNLVADLVARQEEARFRVRADLRTDIAVHPLQALVGVLAKAVTAQVGEGQPGVPRSLVEAGRGLLPEGLVAAPVDAGGEPGIAAPGG